jgi:hypothetical protein
MIVSFRDGRVRLRSPALCPPKALEEIKGMLAACAGVEKIESNARTGSLLVLYDPAALSQAQLDMAIALLESRFPALAPRRNQKRSNTPGLTWRTIEKRLLCGSMLATLAGAVSGMKPLHIAGGALFFLLAARHVYVRRKTL